jgi:ribosomal protein L24E
VRNIIWAAGLCVGLVGCGADAPPATTSSPAAAPTGVSPAATTPVTGAPAAAPAPAPLPKISLGGGGSSAGPNAASANAAATAAGFTRDEVLAALKPMQILRDEWNAVRQKSVGSQDAGEDFSWIWDHRTNPKQPALVMTSPNGKYFHHLRLSYDPPHAQFQLELTDPEDKVRQFTGDYSEPVQEVTTADNKVHRVYKLQLTEVEPSDGKDQWQLVLNQQENNRYLLEMNRKRGESFQRFETISAQRKGTSFALSDTDYGDRTCVISGGLGTMQVSYNGKSYWVCCSGCQAAFNEEPARWIAEYEAKQKAAMP